MQYQWGDNGFGDGPYGGGGSVPAGDSSISVTPIDHVQQGLSRVIKQYQESTKFLAYLTTILSISNQVENVLQALFLLPSISVMEGVNLDTIGVIIGQSRYVPQAIQIPYFGFADTPDGQGFGEATDVTYGAPFMEFGQTNTATSVLGDAAYRILLGTRIIKNAAKATPENIMAALAYLFSTTVVNCVDTAPMHLTLSIGRYLTLLEKAIYRQLDLLPRPAGVTLDGLITYNPNNYFGFADQPNALGFGEFTNPSIGGQFAEMILA
jgi:hypothetical protein